MSTFKQFTKIGLTHTIKVIGEPASIGGNQFQASFDETDMDVTRHMYGDEDEMTTQAVLLKSAVTNAPRVGETLIRVDQRKTYVITEVQSDVESYELNLRAKDG
jgi:4-hydroxy-L-threonine phosphate dehydrogenase PdxA